MLRSPLRRFDGTRVQGRGDMIHSEDGEQSVEYAKEPGYGAEKADRVDNLAGRGDQEEDVDHGVHSGGFVSPEKGLRNEVHFYDESGGGGILRKQRRKSDRKCADPIIWRHRH